MTPRDPARGLPEWIEVGRVIRPHGVRGEVSIAVESDTTGRFAAGAVVWRDGARLEIASQRRHKGVLLVGFTGVTDRDQASELRGWRLCVPRHDVPPAPSGQFYFFELQGCRVIDESEGELGVVVEVHEDGGGLLLEVAASAPAQQESSQNEDGSAEVTLLIPFVQRHLIAVDVGAGLIRTRLPDGLVELCASTS